MPKYYDIKTRELTREEKINNALDYLYYDGPFEYGHMEQKLNPNKVDEDDYDYIVDVEKCYDKLLPSDKKFFDEFVNKTVYEKSVEVKCLKCGDEDEYDLDLFQDAFFPIEDYEAPTTTCKIVVRIF